MAIHSSPKRIPPFKIHQKVCLKSISRYNAHFQRLLRPFSLSIYTLGRRYVNLKMSLLTCHPR